MRVLKALPLLLLAVLLLAARPYTSADAAPNTSTVGDADGDGTITSYDEERQNGEDRRRKDVRDGREGPEGQDDVLRPRALLPRVRGLHLLRRVVECPERENQVTRRRPGSGKPLSGRSFQSGNTMIYFRQNP